MDAPNQAIPVKINHQIMSEIIRNNTGILSDGEVIYRSVKKAGYEVDMVIRQADNSILVTKIADQYLSQHEITELYREIAKDFGSNTNLLVIFTGKYSESIVHPRIKILALDCYLSNLHR